MIRRYCTVNVVAPENWVNVPSTMTLIVAVMTAEACPVPAVTVYVPTAGAGVGGVKVMAQLCPG